MSTNRQIVFGFPLPDVSYALRPAAYAVLISRRGETAAVRGRAGYFLPGGGMDAGETPEETVIREVREELGCDVVLHGKIGTAIQYFIANDGSYRMPATFFKGALASEPSGEGEHQLLGISPHDVEDRLYHECHVRAVRKAID